MDRAEAACSAWIQKIPYIGSKTMFYLKEQFGSMEKVYCAPEKEISLFLNKRQLEAFLQEKERINPDQYLNSVEKRGIRYICFGEEIYPQKLQNIPDPPYGLFVKGSLPEGDKPSVAIIGARACSEYGKKAANYFAEQLAAHQIQIISGMARGIDSVSQNACIRNGGHTYAVLGNGVDICYPEEMKGLYEKMQECGGLISAYAPGMPPLSQNFPPRNRIISGLSDVVLVIEARKKSGTLITVDMALEQGREVAVIPGRITDSLSEGCHQLLKQGANIILDAEQLLELVEETFSLQNNIEQNKFIMHRRGPERINNINGQEVDKIKKCILKNLSDNPAEYVETEEIYKKVREAEPDISFTELLQNLLDLELMDLCKSNKNRFTIR